MAVSRSLFHGLHNRDSAYQHCSFTNFQKERFFSGRYDLPLRIGFVIAGGLLFTKTIHDRLAYVLGYNPERGYARGPIVELYFPKAPRFLTALSWTIIAIGSVPISTVVFRIFKKNSSCSGKYDLPLRIGFVIAGGQFYIRVIKGRLPHVVGYNLDTLVDWAVFTIGTAPISTAVLRIFKESASNPGGYGLPLHIGSAIAGGMLYTSFFKVKLPYALRNVQYTQVRRPLAAIGTAVTAITIGAALRTFKGQWTPGGWYGLAIVAGMLYRRLVKDWLPCALKEMTPQQIRKIVKEAGSAFFLGNLLKAGLGKEEALAFADQFGQRSDVQPDFLIRVFDRFVPLPDSPPSWANTHCPKPHSINY